MPLFGKIVVIRRDGADGAQFPLTDGTCVFGRNADCDIRVQLPNVAKEHCRIEVDGDGNIFLVNLCPVYPTLLNKNAVTERAQVQHMDVFTVTDRSFRVEFPPGSPFRKGRPSTDSVPSIKPPVKSEDVESWALQLSTLTVKDEKPLLSTNTELSVAAKRRSSSKMGMCTPKGKTPTAKSRTPSSLVRPPLHKAKATSPTVRSSAKSQAKTQTGVRRETHTPLTGQRNTNFRIGGAHTVTPRSKPLASSSSFAKSTSALFADEIAELKLTLTKPMGPSPARPSVQKTPVGTAGFRSTTLKASTPVAIITPRVRSNVVPTPKSNRQISASISKTLAVTPAAKTPMSVRSKGLTTKTSSVHRVKTVMTPSPRARAQKRRASGVPSPMTEIAKRSPLQNIVSQTDDLDAPQDSLKVSLEDRTSSEAAPFAEEQSQSHSLSPAKTFGRPNTGSPRISSSTGPSTRRTSYSPAIPSPGSSLARSKLHSPRRGRAKSSPQKMLQSPETRIKKRHSFNSSNAGANEAEKGTPAHNISSQSIDLIPSEDDTEVVKSNLEVAFRDKSSDEAESPDGKSHRPESTPAEGDVRKRSRGSKVSSPGEHPASVKSQSPNVEAHTKARNLSTLTSSTGSYWTCSESQSPLSSPAKSHSPPRRSAESSAEQKKMSDGETPVLHRRSSTRPSASAKRSLVRGKSNSPLRSSAKSAAVRLSQGVETPALPRRSSSRPSAVAKQSPKHEVFSEASTPNVPQVKTEAVRTLATTSFGDTILGEIFFPTDKKLNSPNLSPDVDEIRRKSQSSLTGTRSSSPRSKPQSPLGSSAELSAQKLLQSSQMPLVGEGKAKWKLQSVLESPVVASRRASLSPTTSSTRRKSKSPNKSPSEPTADRSLQHSDDSTIGSLHSDDSTLTSLTRRKSQHLEVSSPSKNQDSIPAVTDDCFLESYEQQFSPLILEMDDVDENKESPKKTTPMSGPKHGGSDAESLKSAVVRLRRKSQPLLEEADDETFNNQSAGKEIDSSEEFDQTFEEKSFVSPSQGIKRPGSPLKGRARKRQCVSFGPDMSPELFDRSLPVITPLKRGATPRRRSSSADQAGVPSKPLLKNRRSVLVANAAVFQEEPQEAGNGKSPKGLKATEKLSKALKQNPVLESVTTLDAEAFTLMDSEPSQPVISPLRRQIKPRRASVVEAVTYPKSARKSRRATLATAGVIPEDPFEDNTEKSPKSPKVQVKESAALVNVMDATVLFPSEMQTPVSSVTSTITNVPQTGSQKCKIFTSGTGAERLSRALKTPPAVEVATSNENSPAVKTSARKEKTPKRPQSLPPRSSLPLTNMQNSSVLHQELDPFAFESSPESSPAKSTPKRTGQGKNNVSIVASEDLATGFVLESGKKKLLSKSQEDVSTPNVTLDFTVSRSGASLVKSSRSVERISAKDVRPVQEHELLETPTTIVMEGPRLTGRRLSNSKPVNEAVYETPAATTPNIPKSIERRSSRFLDKDQEEHVTEVTPLMDKASSRRAASDSKLTLPKSDGKVTSEQVLEEKRSIAGDSAAKTPGSTGKRRIKSEESFKTADAKMIGKSSGGGVAMPAGDGKPTPNRFSNRKSSSPFKRPFGSEPRKLRISQIGELFRHSPEEARKATRHVRNKAGQMVSERNIDLSSLSPLKFYKSPAVDALTGKRSKVTPGRAVALRAVYGKTAVPPLAELQMTRKASEGNSVKPPALVDESSKSVPTEKSHSSRATKRKKSAIQAVTKKRLEKKMGFAVKKKPTKVLLLKRVGRRSVGQVVKKLLPARKRNPRTMPDQKSLPNIAENDVLQVSPGKGLAMAKLSKSASSYSALSTPDGPGEMNVSPWSSPVRVLSGKRRSGDRAAIVDDTSKGQNSPSLDGLQGFLASSNEGDSPTHSGMNSPVKMSQTESSHQLLGVTQLAKSPVIERSPQLSGGRKLVKTPKAQISPQLDGVRKLVKTPKAQKSPQLSGVRKLVKTPKAQKSPQLSGVRKLVKTPKAQQSPRLAGVRNLVKTPRLQKSPKLGGVKLLVKSPIVQKSPQLSGVKKLMRTPKVQKSPRFIGVRDLVRTPKMQKSPKLSGVRDLVMTPKDQQSPKLIGIRSLVRTPKTQKSPKLSGVKILVKTPKGDKSPRLHGLKKLVKTPKVQKSPLLSGVRNLMRTPKVQESPDLTGVRSLVKSFRRVRTPHLDELNVTPQVLNSSGLSELKKLVQSPATQSSLPVSGTRTMSKTPKSQGSAKLEGVWKLVKTPKMRPTPKRARSLVHLPKEILSPELEGVRDLFQTPFVQKSTKKTRAPPEVEAELRSPKASVAKRVARKVKSTDELLKLSVTPIVTELKETQEIAPLEVVRPVRRLRKPISVDKVKDTAQMSTENARDDENVGKDNKTVAAKTRKRKIAESGEEPAAQKRRVAAEIEDSARNEGKELHSAVKKGRGSKKIAAETLTDPLEIASVSNAGGHLHRKKGKENSALHNEALQVVSAAPSPKQTVSRNSRSQRSKTAKVEQVILEENVPATVEEPVKVGARRQARSSKKDLPEELAVKGEEKVKSKTKGKGKATQSEMEVLVQETGVENIEAFNPLPAEESNGRRQGRGKRDGLKEVVPAEAVQSKVVSKTRARGKTITTKVEVAEPEQMSLEENFESSVAVKVGNKRAGRAKGDANEKLNVQSKAIVTAPERKSRARTKGKSGQTEVEVKVDTEASVPETVRLGSRRQARPLKKGISEEADIETETAANKTGRKVGSRGKTKALLAEAVEENKEKTLGPNVKNQKQTAKKDAVESSAVDDADVTVEVKRPVIGRKTKSGGEKAKGKGGAVASEEPAVTVEDETIGMLLNKKNESAVVASGKRGRKGAAVEPVNSDAEAIAEVIQSSRKRKAKVVEESAPTKSKKARMYVESVVLETAKEALSPQPLKRGSRKTGVANNKDGHNLANEKLDAADNEPTATSAGSRNKKKAEIALVSTTAAEAIETNAPEKKRGKIASNKAKSAEGSTVSKSKNAVTSQKRKTIEQTTNEIDEFVGLQPKGKPRKVKFDVPATPVVVALEKAAPSTARGRRGASKRGSENKTAVKELPAPAPKTRVSRGASTRKDTAPPPPPSAKRALRAARK